MSIFQSHTNIGIYLVWARPGQGKTADTARVIRKLVKQYNRTEKKYPQLPKRVLYCNMKLSSEVENKFGDRLVYWENPRQLKKVRDCDIVIDEVQNYCPADGWANLPKYLRKLFSQYRHRGIRIFATTQDYKAVDINFRRMVRNAYKVSKIFSSRDISATMPPVRFIFGLCVKREFDPEQIEHDGTDIEQLEEVSGFPTFFWLGKKLINTYDTTQDIPEYMPDKLEEIVQECELGDACRDPRHKLKIIHRPI